MNNETITRFLTDHLFEIFSVFLTILSGFLFRTLFIERRNPKAYLISIIGNPASGKTTFLTRLFSEIFDQRIGNINAIPTGEENIIRTQNDIKLLNSGTKIPPTKLNEVIPYTAIFEFKSIFWILSYQAIFNDFPGERSTELSNLSNILINENIRFYRNISSAKAYIFFIDLAKYLEEKKKGTLKEHLNSLKTYYQAVWQLLINYHIEDLKQVKFKPVALVFSKSDLLKKPFYASVDEIHKYGYEVYPKLIKFNLEREINSTRKKKIEIPNENTVIEDFNDLISYFKSNCRNFDYFFISNFVREEESSEMLNFQRLINFIFDR